MQFFFMLITPTFFKMAGQNTDIESLTAQVPSIEYVLPHGHLFEGAMHVVLNAFKNWREDDVELIQFKDGITNKLVCATHKPTNSRVLIRAFGRKSEVIIDRHQEIINILTLHAAGLCPPLYANFTNGLIYGYIPGRIFSVNDMTEPKMASLVAEKMGRWHRVEILGKGPKEATLWTTMRKWIDRLPAVYSNPLTQATVSRLLNMTTLRKQLEDIETACMALEPEVVFSHNDLLYANLIYDEEGNGGKGEAHFIDYEYGSYGYRGFDIGNHFNEFAGFECTYSSYPNTIFQKQFLTIYLTAASPTQTHPTDAALASLYRETARFSLASHFYWALWALLQADVSDIDFDYAGYGVLRIREMERVWEERMAITGNEVLSVELDAAVWANGKV